MCVAIVVEKEGMMKVGVVNEVMNNRMCCNTADGNPQGINPLMLKRKTNYLCFGDDNSRLQ